MNTPEKPVVWKEFENYGLNKTLSFVNLAFHKIDECSSIQTWENEKKFSQLFKMYSFDDKQHSMKL